MTRDKNRRKHTSGRGEKALAARSVLLTPVLIKFNSPFAFFFVGFFSRCLLAAQQTVMSQDEGGGGIIATSACLGSVVVVERWLLRPFLVSVVLSE